MFARLSNSWELVKASWHVLLADKELLIFPIISFVASLIVMATFAIPTLFAGLLDSMITDSGVSIFGYIVAFLFYVTLYTVTIFANAALVGAAMIRLKGGEPHRGRWLPDCHTASWLHRRLRRHRRHRGHDPACHF